MLWNKEQVMAYLPHRDPFLFIDSVEKIVPSRELKEGELLELKELVGSSVVARYRTKSDHPIFAGHFPGNPILPGVVQVEMMAQGSSFVIPLTHEDPTQIDLEVALVAVTNAKFRKPIYPDMDLEVHAECTKCRASMIGHDCKIYHDGQLMSEASVLASFKMK